MTPKPDMTQKAGRKGLAQRLRDRGHVVAVGRITKRDKGGMRVRKASLDDLKGESRG